MEDAAEVARRIRALVEQGALIEAAEQGERAAALATGPARAELLLALAAARAAAGRFFDALRAAAESSDLFKQAGVQEGLCDAMAQIAATLRAAGDPASAISTLEQAEEIARALGDPLRLGRVLRNLGVCCSLLGRHQHALSCLHEADEHLRPHAPGHEQRTARLSLLNARNRRLPAPLPARGTAEADAAWAEALALLEAWSALADDAHAAGQQRLALMARGNHAITLHLCERTAEAAAELEALVPLYRELAMRPNEGLCHAELGRCLESLRSHVAARDHYRLAIAILRDGGTHDDLLASLDGLSRCEERLGDPAAALAALRELRSLEQRRSDEAARQAVHQRELRIELARLTSQWAQMAATDPLTGLGNRRALERWLDEHWRRVEHGESLVFLLLDLDHFKRVNDGFGHDVGDRVLQAVARLLQTHCRAADLAVRYGGEEFLLATVGASRADAESVAERLRETVCSHDWGRIAPGLAVTTSIGVADAAEVLDAGALVTLVDRRLYAAKYGGRNRVVVRE